MADKVVQEPEYGPHGVDRWSCNGYGLTINGKKVEPIEDNEDVTKGQDIDEIDEV